MLPLSDGDPPLSGRLFCPSAGPAQSITHTLEVAFDWSLDAPELALPRDGFSARFQRYLTLPKGVYQFTVQVQGGARLWVDGRLLVDRWEGPRGTYTAMLELPTGDHLVRLEYNDPGGAAAAHLWWAGPLVLSNRLYLPLIRQGD